MKVNKEELIQKARKRLQKESLLWLEYNNGYHFKVGTIDFWPTTGKWNCKDTDKWGFNIESLIKHISKEANKIPSNKLSVQDLLKIASKVQPANLINICEAIHKEIYK